MTTYVYGCENGHRQEEIHGMIEDPQINCLICNSTMWRIPQPMTFYRNPFEVLCDQHDKKFAEIVSRDKRFKNKNPEGVIK